MILNNYNLTTRDLFNFLSKFKTGLNRIDFEIMAYSKLADTEQFEQLLSDHDQTNNLETQLVDLLWSLYQL